MRERKKRITKADKVRLEIQREFSNWKNETDKILKVPEHMQYNKRKKLIEEIYIIKEEKGEEIILSAGTMLWLYLNGTNQSTILLDELNKNIVNTKALYLEELKIRHRLDLFKLNTNDFDKEKIEESIENDN